MCIYIYIYMQMLCHLYFYLGLWLFFVDLGETGHKRGPSSPRGGETDSSVSIIIWFTFLHKRSLWEFESSTYYVGVIDWLCLTIFEFKRLYQTKGNRLSSKPRLHLSKQDYEQGEAVDSESYVTVYSIERQYLESVDGWFQEEQKVLRQLWSEQEQY